LRDSIKPGEDLGRFVVRYVSKRSFSSPNEYRKALVFLLRLAASTLLLSNSIRHWVVFEGSLMLGDKALVVTVDGSRVKGLAPQVYALEGIAAAILERGYWPGIRAAASGKPLECTGCTRFDEFLKQTICPRCLCVEEAVEATFKPWWLLAALMVVHDERCVCGGGGPDS
jgi:hypothetical protein